MGEDADDKDDDGNGTVVVVVVEGTAPPGAPHQQGRGLGGTRALVSWRPDPVGPRAGGAVGDWWP